VQTFVFRKEIMTRILCNIERRRLVNDSFGSYFSIKGKKQTAHLGHSFIRELENPSLG